MTPILLRRNRTTEGFRTHMPGSGRAETGIQGVPLDSIHFSILQDFLSLAHLLTCLYLPKMDQEYYSLVWKLSYFPVDRSGLGLKPEKADKRGLAGSQLFSIQGLWTYGPRTASSLCQGQACRTGGNDSLEGLTGSKVLEISGLVQPDVSL